MIVCRIEVDPLALMLERGGSIGGAMRVTHEAIQHAVDMGAGPGSGLEARASWVAIVVQGEDAALTLGTVEWDPHSPIPVGAILLRCTGYAEPA